MAWRVFDVMFRPWMTRHVRIHVSGGLTAPDADVPVLLVANHESFWDGFLLREVQRAIRPEACFHAVMLARELRRRPFLRLLGGIGVEPGSVSSIKRLLRSLTLLRHHDPAAVLAYFPQGAIHPGTQGPLRLRRGILGVAEVMAPVAVVPVGIRLLPGLSHRLEAYVSVGEPLMVQSRKDLSLPLLGVAIGGEVDAITAFVAHHGEAAPTLWPSFPRRLPRPCARNAPLYDVRNWVSRN